MAAQRAVGGPLGKHSGAGLTQVPSDNSVVWAWETQVAVDGGSLGERGGERAEQNSNSWRAAINACAMGSDWSRVVDLLDWTPDVCAEQDNITYSAAISACEQAGEWLRVMELSVETTHGQVEHSTATFHAANSGGEKQQLQRRQRRQQQQRQQRGSSSGAGVCVCGSSWPKRQVVVWSCALSCAVQQLAWSLGGTPSNAIQPSVLVRRLASG